MGVDGKVCKVRRAQRSALVGCRVPEGSPHRRGNGAMATEAQGLLGKHQTGAPSRGLHLLPDFPREVK